MIDRMMSDAAREMASDLLVRVLGLTGVPSARAFEDEQQQKEIAGIDDGDLGPRRSRSGSWTARRSTGRSPTGRRRRGPRRGTS